MANSAKRRGDAGEREVASILSTLLGIQVRRKLGAGRSDDTGDLANLPDTVAQVKNFKDWPRAVREGLPSVEVQRHNADATHGVLFVRLPGRQRAGRWIAVQTVEQWSTMFRETL